MTFYISCTYGKKNVSQHIKINIHKLVKDVSMKICVALAYYVSKAYTKKFWD